MGDTAQAVLSPFTLGASQLIGSPGNKAKKEQRRARREAQALAAKQREMMKRREQQERLKLAEAESEVAKKRAMMRRPGRSMLIATSPRGVVNTLGGTNA